jgi:predicted PolB exonuclease-like 3'-5' exonuclease
MKANTRLLTGVFILSMYLISCYPQKEILGKWPDGKLKVVRYHKRNNKNDERFVEYYDNGRKKYVRYWKNDLDEIYKTKAWYKSGAKELVGWRKFKDTVRKYSNSDSEFVFTGLVKGYTKEWYEDGKIKFETVTKDNLLLYNYYNEQGLRTKQEVVTVVRPDGYDTVEFKTMIEPSGKRYGRGGRPDYSATDFFLGE